MCTLMTWQTELNPAFSKLCSKFERKKNVSKPDLQEMEKCMQSSQTSEIT